MHITAGSFPPPVIYLGQLYMQYEPNLIVSLQAEPIRVVVTGAAGQIAYSLLYSIAKGDVFGKDQVRLSLISDYITCIICRAPFPPEADHCTAGYALCGA